MMSLFVRLEHVGGLTMPPSSEQFEKQADLFSAKIHSHKLPTV
jgi:hypothetical protein